MSPIGFWLTTLLQASAAVSTLALVTPTGTPSPLSLTQFKNLPYNFTLAAWNVTLANANETGVPLVLGQDGATTGMSFQVTSTYASYPFNDFPFLSLIDGSLRAYLSSGTWMTNATEPHDGDLLTWISSTFYSRPAATVFSVVNAPAYQLPMLAVHGREDLWSLCPSKGFRGQTNVVYDVDEGVNEESMSFDPKECYAVRIHVVNAS